MWKNPNFRMCRYLGHNGMNIQHFKYSSSFTNALPSDQTYPRRLAAPLNDHYDLIYHNWAMVLILIITNMNYKWAGGV